MNGVSNLKKDKRIEDWLKEDPLFGLISQAEEVVWINNKKIPFSKKDLPIAEERIYDAEHRLQRFSSLIMKAFEETAQSGGTIESELSEVKSMKTEMRKIYSIDIKGRLFLKEDHNLPIAGSIKARGGIYEVLKIAEGIAIESGFDLTHDYAMLLTDVYRKIFSQYEISVGSTGNLGLSIGIMAAKLGFQVTVHMSRDAKQWKKDLLREKGAKVIEHESDYSQAVAAGRDACLNNENCFFIDDENSIDLFLGYSVAGLRLKQQLIEKKVKVDEDHPLFVYLPCGVGGGPGGITYGLKHLFGDHVHCFFAEPTQSPCMLLGLATELYDQVTVQDFGLENHTEADGLAVGCPSSFVCKTVGPYLNGIYTIKDGNLYTLLSMLYKTEGISMEPSALAGVYGPVQLFKSGWMTKNFSEEQLKNSTHIVWGTGGSLVPENIMQAFIKRGNN